MSLGDEERERDEAEDDLEDALPPPAPLPPRASLLFLRSLLLLRERLEDDRDDDLRFHNDLIIKLCRFSHTLLLVLSYTVVLLRSFSESSFP